MGGEGSMFCTYMHNSCLSISGVCVCVLAFTKTALIVGCTCVCFYALINVASE